MSRSRLGRNIQGAVQIVWAGRSHGEASVEPLDKPDQQDIAVRHVGHTGEAEFFDQAILKGAVNPLWGGPGNSDRRLSSGCS
jgi:hypothetical protein